MIAEPAFRLPMQQADDMHAAQLKLFRRVSPLLEQRASGEEQFRSSTGWPRLVFAILEIAFFHGSRHNVEMRCDALAEVPAVFRRTENQAAGFR